MSERDHTLIEELLSVDALGGLDEADLALLDRERASHGACQECERLETELSEVAGRLGLALEPVAVRHTMVDDILSGQGDDAAREPLVVVPDDRDLTVARPPLPDLTERREARSPWRGLAAVAAAIALFAGGWILRDATAGAGRQLAQPRLVRFTGGTGTVAMTYRPGEPGVVVFGSGLPDPGAGRVYEIWMIQGDRPPVSGGCVVPRDGRVLTYVGASIGSADTMAVTVESASCPTAPTTDPVLTASL